MGTAYEYYSKLRVMQRVFARIGAPRTMLALGLPEKHGYDLDFVWLAHSLRSGCFIRHGEPVNRMLCPASNVTLTVCDDRPEVLTRFEHALQRLPDSAMRRQVELVQIESLTDTRTLTARMLHPARFDWVVSTASVQRLPNEQIVAYLQNAREMADYAFLFLPNSGNRAHLTLSGLRGLDLDETLALCQRAEAEKDPGCSIRHGPRRRSGPMPTLRRTMGGTPPLLAAGYCDIPPFPPGLQRSTEAKERAMHSPLETLAMWGLQWWCRGERWVPVALQKRLAHLVYVALDLREEGA
jgi:hypothetical protein